MNLTIKYFDDKIVTLMEYVIMEMKERCYKSYESEIGGYKIKIEKIEKGDKN